MSQENAEASQWQPVMQATAEHQQFHKDRGESGRQEIGLTPLVKIKWAHIQRHTHTHAWTHTHPSLFRCTIFHLLKAKIWHGDIVVCCKWCLSQSEACACVFVCLCVSEGSVSCRLCN